MFRVVASLLLCVLSGCAQTQLEHQSDSLNRASAATISEHVLLNAVRASLDLPMSFTKLQKFTAENMAKGSFVPKFPFGPDAVKAYDFGPTLNWSSGVSAIEYVDVNTAGALAKLNQSLQYDTIDRYAAEGMPLAVLSAVFVNYVEIHRLLGEALAKRFRRKCRTPAQENRATCLEVERIAAVCKLWFDERPVTLEGGHEFFIIRNTAQSECAFLTFSALALVLRISGYASDLLQDTTYETIKTPEGKRVPVPKTRTLQGIRFAEREVQQTYARLERVLKPHKNRLPMKFAMRSPRSALSYLGQLIALQNFSRDAYVPEIVLRDGQRITVFRVVRTEADARGAALSVRGPYGETYFVPHPKYGSATRDQSLRLLSIVGEVVNAAISEKDFPAPASVVVRAIQ